MIKTTSILIDELHRYSNPACKIGRMVKNGEIFPIVKGLYETDGTTSGYLLAGSIYGPSYLSFEFALSYYSLIPEAVYVFTSATFEKKKSKSYNTLFGKFYYRDVPSSVFPLEVKLCNENSYDFMIASPEKALCDMLYAKPPVKNQRELKSLLFEDMRIDRTEFKHLDKGIMAELALKYRCTNLKLFAAVLRRDRYE